MYQKQMPKKSIINNMNNEYSLADTWEMHKKEYKKELSKRTEISKKTRQYELILFKLQNFIYYDMQFNLSWNSGSAQEPIIYWDGS